MDTLVRGSVYYFPREGRRVAFLGYDEADLAQVMDGDRNEYLCHANDLLLLTEQAAMTIEDALKREG